MSVYDNVGFGLRLKQTTKDVYDVSVARKASCAGNGDASMLGVRPHDLTIVENGSLSGSVDVIERLGNETVINVALSSGAQLVAALDGDIASEVCAPITLDFAPEKAFLFDTAGLALPPAASNQS